MGDLKSCKNCKHLNTNYWTKKKIKGGSVTIYYCEKLYDFVMSYENPVCERWEKLEKQLKLF